MSVSLSPVLNGMQFFDNAGNPLAGGRVSAYFAGSYSSQATTFTSAAGNVANNNPIILNSSGRLPNEIWLTDGTLYHFVATMPDSTTVLIDLDHISGTTGAGAGLPTPGATGTVLTSVGVGVTPAWQAVGSSPTGIYQLFGQGTGTFGGAQFKAWNVSPLQTNAAVTVGGGTGSGTLQVNASGIYRVTVHGKVTMLSSANWPDLNTAFGIYLPNALSYANKTTHSRLGVTGSTQTQNAQVPFLSPSGISNQESSWDDEFIIQDTGGHPDITPQMYVAGYLGSSTQCNMYCLVTVQKISS